MQISVNNNLQNNEILSVQNLSVRFGGLKAVDNISFSLGRGEVFGLVGESGSGKTTAGRAIIRLTKLSSGSIFFRGERIAVAEDDKKREISNTAREYREGKISKEDCRGRVRTLKKEIHLIERDNRKYKGKAIPGMQMIFQDPIASLNPRHTVGESIAEGLKISGIKDKRYIDGRVQELLLRVGLNPAYRGRYPHEFSGGQRQRIGIARALIMNPELIIADEPVSALDVSVQAQVINLLSELRRELGLSVLFIAHDLSVVKYFSDRIGVMRFGRLVECAEADELFESPLHPYTRALLSAIPVPDPLTERMRKRIVYNPDEAHDYSEEPPSYREIRKGHFVLCNSKEREEYMRMLK